MYSCVRRGRGNEEEIQHDNTTKTINENVQQDLRCTFVRSVDEARYRGRRRYFRRLFQAKRAGKGNACIFKLNYMVYVSAQRQMTELWYIKGATGLL